MADIVRLLSRSQHLGYSGGQFLPGILLHFKLLPPHL